MYTVRMKNKARRQCFKKVKRAKKINLRTALLWVITQRVVAVSYRRFGTIGPIFREVKNLNPGDGTDRVLPKRR